MKLEEVMQLRPEASDSASLASAITRAEQARVASAEKARDLLAQRSAALLSASDAEIRSLEEGAADAQRAADRIAALIEAMQGELEAAEKREVKEEALRLLERANGLSNAFLSWWRVDYPKHAEAIRAGLILEQQADAARGVATVALKSAGLGRQSIVYPAAEITGSGSLWALQIGTAFQLPAEDGTIWPGSSRNFKPYWVVQDLRRTDIS